MMTCRELVEVLLDFVTDQLSPELHQRIELHLERCPSCCAYLDSYRTTVVLPRRLPALPLPPQLTARLQMILVRDCPDQITTRAPTMSKFQEFCESFWVGKAKTEEERLEREEELRNLPGAIGKVVQRLIASFGCPNEQAHYVDLQAGAAVGTVQGSDPPLRFNAEKGCYSLGLEIRVGDQPGTDQYPVWLNFEVVPRKHGGFEFHFQSAIFQIPTDEDDLFNGVAEAINQRLREGCGPAPCKMGF